MNGEEKHDWGRLAGESSKAYHHFSVYRDMGLSRSLRHMADVPTCTAVVRQLNRWSPKWRWVERCQAYDDYFERERRLQQEKERREMNERHAKIAILGQNVAVKGIEKLLANVQNGQQNLGPSELVRLVDVSVKVERLARGESTDVHESVGPGGGPVRLSIESVEQKAREAIEKSLGIADRAPVRGAEADREPDLPFVPDPLGDGDEPAGVGG